MSSPAPITPDPLTDEQLAARTLAGHRDAFNHLIRRHERPLFRFLCKNATTEADAEDAMQHALIKAYVNLSKYDPRYRFGTWLFTIALRELRSLRRRQNRGPSLTTLDGSPDPQAPAQPAPDFDGPGDLWRTAKRVLRADPYAVLWLRYGEDLPARDIAKVMGRPRIWVSVTLHRAVAALRNATERPTGASEPEKSPFSRDPKESVRSAAQTTPEGAQ